MRKMRKDSGYATVASVGIILAICSLLFVITFAVARVAARHEAQVAADLSAVAAAWDLAMGEPACTKAETVAELNGAALRECREEGQDVIVVAVVRGSPATARAGPI